MEMDALSGKVGIDNILFRFMDTPTKINPVSAAEAPAVATKKSCHSFMWVG
jgi:hypothetical protein